MVRVERSHGSTDSGAGLDHNLGPAERRRTESAGPLVAGGQLPLGGTDLPDGQPAARRAARAEARQAPAARPLGHHAGPQFRLRPPQSGHRPRDVRGHLRRAGRATAARPWWPAHSWRAPTARCTRHAQRRGRHAPAVPPILLPRRHTKPRLPRDAGVDTRGRRARLLVGARLRRGVRQPGPGRGVRGWRRRGRDRRPGRELALQQVPRPRPTTAP